MRLKISDRVVLVQVLIQRLIWTLRGLRWVRKLLLVIGSRLVLLEIRQVKRSDSSYRQLDDGEGSSSSTYSILDSDSELSRRKMLAPVGMWKVQNGEAYCFPKFSLVREKGLLLLPTRTEEGPYNLYPRTNPTRGFQVLRSNSKVALARLPEKPILVDSCAYVGTRSPGNWSHWLINFLPGVMVAGEFFRGRFAPPLIVGPGFRDGQARSLLFDHFWPNGGTVLCGEDQLVRSREIYWFEQPFADSPRPVDKKNLKPKFANRAIMAEFRRRLLEFANEMCADGSFPEKIFLAREKTMSRPYNLEEVHAAAHESGYSVVYLNRLPIEQQIAVVANADRIAGPTGSAFANTIVAKHGAKLLEFSFSKRQDKVEDWYAPLADIAGAQYFIDYESLRDNQESDEILFDVGTISKYLAAF